MTNREHLAAALGFSEYEDKDVADIISDSLMEITDEDDCSVAVICGRDKELPPDPSRTEGGLILMSEFIELHYVFGEKIIEKLINTNTIGTVIKRSDGGAIVHIERDSIGQDGTIKPLETYNTIRSLLLDVRRYTDETTP